MDSMTEYPHLAYPMRAVRRAGELLAGDILWTDENRDAALETFAIANSWRDSHVYPMRSVRGSVVQRMRQGHIGGFTAARPKRMSSIRNKLRRYSVNLEQINDIAGCRAVLDDIDGVRQLIAACREIPHELKKEYPYIDEPKDDGYRSHHMVFSFSGGTQRSAFSGRRIELQIRTRLQHSWATAVEAVGLYRNEDMKAGQGNRDWLRLFQLVSLEFAFTEGCHPITELPSRDHRIAEIRVLNGKLGAIKFLDDLKNATSYFSNFVHGEDRPNFYLIKYDNTDHSVRVEGYSSPLASSASLGAVEQRVETGNDNINAVLVEVSKIDRLVEAYPNYFGDVTLFTKNLRAICDGKQAIEYTMARQQIVAPKPKVTPDLSWFKRRHRW
nr:RelA/SpoT domain-containing protein [Phyllobacterium sp. KW56]